MGVNFSHFEIGRRALRAGQLGISVAGQNIANVNTPGYARQTVQLSPAPPQGANLSLTGTGVQIDGVRAQRDRFVETRLQTETGTRGRLTAQRDALAPVETALASNEAGGVGSRLEKFFNSFRDLEANPQSVPLRGVAVEQGAALASSFRATHDRLARARGDAVEVARADAEEVNRLASQVADLNRRIGAAEGTGGNASELRDTRGETVRRLAELAGVRATEDRGGAITLALADGQALVAGDHVASLAVTLGADGAPVVTLDGAPAVIDDGAIRGALDAASSIDSHLEQLDLLAASVAARVNELHAGGSDLNGADGAPFFVSSVAGAPVSAANIEVSPALRADPRRVVAAAHGAGAGDGSVARSIADLLSDQTSTAGARTGSFASIFGAQLADAGAQLSNIDDRLATQGAILSQIEAQRDQASGVSLDEEAINLLQSQKAYEAAARFLRIADEMTQTILSLGQ